MTQKHLSSAIWFATPNLLLLELIAQTNCTKIVLDIEHGLFDLSMTDHFILTARSMNIDVYAKVLAPEMSPIQQMLDFGVKGVIIPHITSFEDAKRACAYTKYPPLGERSCGGGRTFEYKAGGSKHFNTQNHHAKCYPMIETQGAFSDLEKILSLETVDGVFIGPTDLSLSRGRGGYEFNLEDQSDIKHIALMAQKHGKEWLMPAWNDAEKLFSQNLNVDLTVIAHERGIITKGLSSVI